MLVVPQMRPHKTFPQFPVIGDGEVQELVHDNVIRQVSLQGQKLGVEIEAPGCRAGGPFVPHRPDGEGTNPYTKLVCPCENMVLELVFVAPAFHGRKLL